MGGAVSEGMIAVVRDRGTRGGRGSCGVMVMKYRRETRGLGDAWWEELKLEGESARKWPWRYSPPVTGTLGDDHGPLALRIPHC